MALYSTPNLQAIYAIYLLSDFCIATDTRKLKPNALFFALQGPNFDANSFALAAISLGAQAAVVSDAALAEQHPNTLIYVPDTLIALQELSSWHRDMLKIPIIAIGGSNGKTTTKELIQCVLATKYNSFATQGNLNNHIGVPLSLLSINPSLHQIGVIEMGANAAGEIALLCQIARPTHGLITNIGKDHLEGFGDIKGVAAANGELFEYLKDSGGTAFVNTQQDWLGDLAAGCKTILTYPAQVDNYHCEAIEMGKELFLRVRSSSQTTIITKLAGAYNFANVASALAVGAYFGISDVLAAQAISHYEPKLNRSQIVCTPKSNVIVLDAYNANPSSMQAALDGFASLHSPAKLIILGQMSELGTHEQAEHSMLGEYISNLGLSQNAIFCGPLMRFAHQNANGSLYFQDLETCKIYLQEQQISNTHILLKGSRSMKMEELVHDL